MCRQSNPGDDGRRVDCGLRGTVQMRKMYLVFAACLVILTAGCGSSENDEYYEDGIACMEKSEYEEAVTLMNQAIEQEERLPEAYRALGISQYELGDNAAAIAAFSRSLNSLENTNVEFEKDVMYYLALARKDYGEYEKAAEVYTEVLKLEKDPETYFLRGGVYLELDDQERAKSDFDSAVEGSRDYGMYLKIYQAYADKSDTVTGEAYLQRALELKPKEASDYYNRGRIYYELKDYESARGELTEAINEGDADAVLLLGKVYLAVDDAASARGLYQDYLKEEKKQSRAYNGLAMCDIFEKNYENALNNIKKGLECEDAAETQSLLFNEIVVYEYMLDFETAKSKMAEYLEKYPDDMTAVRENEFLKSR